MPGQRITKRLLDSLKTGSTEFTYWDVAISGFGVRVRPTGAMSYVVVYRAGSGRGAPVRRYTIAAVDKITPERARARAKAILGSVAHGIDPAGQKSTERGVPTVAELADRFMAEHIDPKRKGRTAQFYRDILERIVKPAIGTTKADKLTRQQVGKLIPPFLAPPFKPIACWQWWAVCMPLPCGPVSWRMAQSPEPGSTSIGRPEGNAS